MTGSYTADVAEANRLANFAETPEKYMWHHHQEEGLMQLVRKEVHENVRHTGGVNFYEARTGTEYKR